ncbi:hypothetical protein N8085_00680 [Salibacteraceae bacterium]|jgi:hypothetical protein|nr:hypothetical protein [Crocinitomicaceae bacterium]MDA9968115.1 hypothetical protein [Salibacteraceae bacterium]MDC1203897.1 hypothetical protein [Salibacteraceae bacterium]|tara:strand:- start:70 stop:513 length:444 start_codon:yes stop_codon:yes gene_type:complete
MGAIFEIIGLILFSSVKFLFAPSTAYALGYTFWQTILISLIGGWLGVFVFYFAGSFVFDWWSKISKPSDKKFSKKNRIIVWFKNDFGLLGITLVLGFASIPIVSLLAAKYFRHLPITIYALLASTVVWAFLLTGISVWMIPLFKGMF